jgi:hypothetical protein
MKSLITGGTIALSLLASAASAQTTGLDLANAGYAARDPAVAARAFAAAVEAGGLSNAQLRGVRLALADALGAPGDAAARVVALEPLRFDTSFAVQSRLAYALDAANRREDAARAYGAAAAASDVPSPGARSAMLRGRVYALSSLARSSETLAAARELADDENLTRDDAANLAYITAKFGDDPLAQRFFARAEALQPVSGELALNAAYSARRAGDEEAAVRYLRRAVDGGEAASVGSQALYGVRRELADLERRAGAYASVFYDDTGTRSGRIPGAGSGNLQVGGEVYYRPLGYNDGRPLEVFVRAFQSLDSRRGDPTGAETLQGWIGGRYKPLASQNLVLEASALVALGSQALDDAMVRAAWSWTEGVDLRRDRDTSTMAQVYVDVAHLFGADTTFAVADVRYGRAFQPGGGNLIVAPFVGANLSYDSGLSTKAILGAGPGMWLRLWTREDTYRAPRSYIDLALQYRVRLAGDDRGEGLYGVLGFAY